MKSDAFLLGAQASCLHGSPVAGWKPALPGGCRVLHKHPLRRPERPLTTRRLAHGHAAPRTPARRTAVSSSCRLMMRTLVKSDAFLLGAQASCLHGSPVAGWKRAPRRVQGPSQTPTQASRTSFNDPTLGARSCRAANSGATNSRVLIMQVDDEDVGEERCLSPGSAGILPAWIARCGLEARAPRRVQGPSQTPTQASRTSFNDPTLGARSCRAANSGATNSRVLIMQVDDEDVGEERCLPPGSAGILPAWVARCGLEARAPRAGAGSFTNTHSGVQNVL